MNMEESRRCQAILRMGDDHGDNTTTFRCQLGKDHGGRHSEEGSLYNEVPYLVIWKGDMRDTCERCGGKTPSTVICWTCNKQICHECAFVPEGRPRRCTDERCKDCPEEAPKPYTLGELADGV